MTERTLRWLEYPSFFNPQMPRYEIQIFEQGIFNDATCSAIIGYPVNFRMHHWKEQSRSLRTGLEYCESQMHVRPLLPAALAARNSLVTTDLGAETCAH